MITSKFFGIALIIAGTTTGILAQAQKYTVVRDPKHKLAQVESKTAVETFVGKTSDVTGSITFDPKKKTGSGWIELPVNSIDTNIKLRNEHLQSEMWLNSAKNPTIKFTTTKVKFIKGNEYEVTGTLNLNGVTNPVTAKATVRRIAASNSTKGLGFNGDVLSVKTAFQVKLSDYNIKISGQAKGKVAETVDIKLDVFAQTK